MVEKEKCSKKYILKNLTQLDDESRNIRSIFYDTSQQNNESKDFLILVSKEYDKKFEILHSKYSRKRFKIEVQFVVEPTEKGKRI